MPTQSTYMKLLRGERGDVFDYTQFLNGNFDKVDAEMFQRGVNVKWYLAKEDGVSDDTIPLKNALSHATNSTLILTSGATYKVTDSLTVPEGCKIIGNGATINMHLSGNVEGMVLRDNVSINDLTVNVIAVSAATGGGQYQAPIVIGDYGTGTGYDNITLKNVSVHTDRQNGNGIFITGDSSNILVDCVTFPDSSTLGIGVLIHWGGATVPANGTYHPHNIIVRNVKAGALTATAYPAQCLVYVSGAYQVLVENVAARETKRALVQVFAGDYGFVYAPEHVQPLAMSNILIRNAICNLSNTFGFYVDGKANLAAGTPIYETGVRFENCFTVGNGTETASGGFSLSNCKGVSLYDCHAQGHTYGFLTGAGVQDVNIQGGRYFKNYYHGIYLQNGTSAPKDVTIRDVRAYLNGQVGSGNYAGIYTGNSIRTVLDNCKLGDDTAETTQFYGVRVETTSVDASVLNCYVHNVKTGGVGYSMANGTSYGTVKAYWNNGSVTGITLKSGVSPIPLYSVVNGSGATQRRMVGTAAPTSGTWSKKDYVENELESELGTAGSKYTVRGWVCVTAGTPGTWVQDRSLTGN